MEALYHQTNALLEQTQGYFVRLEQGGGEMEAERLQTEIQGRIDTMWSNAERLDMMAGKEPVQRRQVARQRVDQLKYDIHHLSGALQSLVSRAAVREQEALNRETLLNTRFTTNEASRESETRVMIDRALEHQNTLHQTNRDMDNLLDHGASILENLRDQRGILKNAQKKMLDVFNTLGMSNTVIRLIERRSEGDKYILIGGIIGTCFLMWMIIKLFT